ncbi:MAG TPA: AmmeMemoRadiSam system protein B, partial [Candidatus Limnocylindrales bacterium]|nr:AmmeMemoRadiSam system protein B [Candidatus Limnocylindrales bacterium]
MPRTAAAEPGVRRPAVAGIFYPADPARLAATVDRLLGEAPPGTRDGRRPKAIVAPHAGYVYSGAVAAAAWAAARAAAPASPLARVVIAGPAHFVALRGACVPAA